MVGQAGAHLAFGGRVCGWSGGMNGVCCRILAKKRNKNKNSTDTKINSNNAECQYKVLGIPDLPVEIQTIDLIKTTP